MPRPRRQLNVELAARIQRLLLTARSMRAVANLLDCDATTLGRSLAEQSFAPVTRQRIERRISQAESYLAAAAPEEEGALIALPEILHLLQKLYILLPEALIEVEAARTVLVAAHGKGQDDGK